MNHVESPALPPSMKDRKRVPGFRATLIRSERFEALQSIQNATFDPHFDLSDLTDAAVSIALELGADAIVARARAELKHLQ